MGKLLQRFVRPQLGFAKLAQLNQHFHLAGPGGGILRIVFQHFGVGTQ